MKEKLELLFNSVKNECIEIIDRKNINVEELSFLMGMDLDAFYGIINKRCEDFSLYLKLYDIVLKW